MGCQRTRHKRLSLRWGGVVSLWLCGVWSSRAAGAAAGRAGGPGGPLAWMLSDKGPFQQSLEFTEALERYQQGFSTRYKIYR